MGDIMKSKNKKQNTNYFAVITTIIVLLVLALSIGWSAFQSTLLIGSTVAVRINSDIRVTAFSYENGTSNVSSSYTEYGVNFITADVDLPNANSTATYKVEITNLELDQDVEMGIYSFTGLPSNLKVLSTTDYTLKTSICDNNDSSDCGTGAQKTFYITIGYGEDASHNSLYDSSDTEYSFVIYFDFREMHKVTYVGFTNVPTKARIIDGDTPTISLTGDSPSAITVSNVASTLTLNTDYTYSNYELTFLTPVIVPRDPSRGSVTTDSTFSGLAPGYVVNTSKYGRFTSGSRSSCIFVMLTTPRISTASTAIRIV